MDYSSLYNVYKDKYLKHKYNHMTAGSDQVGGKKKKAGKLKSAEMNDWIENTRSKHLTLGDLKKWKKGETKDVIIWDRNFEEYGIWGGLKEEKTYKPAKFFKGNHHKIKYNGDFTWDITFEFGGTITHPVHLDIKKEGTGWWWSPLDGEYIVLDTSYSNGKITKKKKKKVVKKHHSEYRDDTRIGWRGPMMLWEHVESGEPVHYVSPLNK